MLAYCLDKGLINLKDIENIDDNKVNPLSELVQKRVQTLNKNYNNELKK